MEQPPPTAEAVRVWDRPWVVVPVFVLIAAMGGFFDSFTSRANLLVLGVGGVMIWLGLTGRAGRRPSPSALPRSTVWWLVPLLMLALVELFTFAKHSLENYPTLSLLADPFLENYVARSVTYFAWLLGFWGLIRR
jgi:hypothetical protein